MVTAVTETPHSPSDTAPRPLEPVVTRAQTFAALRRFEQPSDASG